jgi:hypothetical protein
MEGDERFAGYVYAKSGTVIGGVPSNRSIIFETRREATDWMLQAVQENKDAGRDVEGQIWTYYNGVVVEKR